MKKLILILTFLVLSLGCNAQLKINIIPETKDYHEHYWISHLMNGAITSAVYYKTRRVGVSMLCGLGGSLLVGIVGKELIYDKMLKRGVYSRRDIEADLLGNMSASYALGVSFGVYFSKPIPKADLSKFEY